METNLSKKNNIYGILISEDLADSIGELFEGETDTSIISDNTKIRKLVKDIVNTIKTSDYDIANMAIIAPSYIRRQIFLVFEQVVPGLSIISKEEIAQGFNLEIIKSCN